MPFLEHIEVLRRHLIHGLFGVVVGAFVLMLNKEILFDYVIFAPARADFFTYRLFNIIGEWLGQPDLLILPQDLQIQNRKLFGQFNTYIWSCVFWGGILASPYVFYELWKFIKPALSIEERRCSQGIIIVASLLFFSGVLFGYFVLFPMAIQFGYGFTISSLPQNIFDLSDYISMITQSVLTMGITFLFPLLAYFLAKSGLITPEFLSTYRKHAFLVLLIIAAAITPSDILSTAIAVLPLLFLYELSVYVVALVYKRERYMRERG